MYSRSCQRNSKRAVDDDSQSKQNLSNAYLDAVRSCRTKYPPEIALTCCKKWQMGDAVFAKGYPILKQPFLDWIIYAGVSVRRAYSLSVDSPTVPLCAVYREL